MTDILSFVFLCNPKFDLQGSHKVLGAAHEMIQFDTFEYERKYMNYRRFAEIPDATKHRFSIYVGKGST